MIIAKLRERRNLLGISQIALAEKVGVSALTIQLWERGAGSPRPENEERLEHILAELEQEQEQEILARRENRINEENDSE